MYRGENDLHRAASVFPVLLKCSLPCSHFRGRFEHKIDHVTRRRPLGDLIMQVTGEISRRQ